MDLRQYSGSVGIVSEIVPGDFLSVFRGLHQGETTGSLGESQLQEKQISFS